MERICNLLLFIAYKILYKQTKINNMKKLTLIALVAISIISCKKKDAYTCFYEKVEPQVMYSKKGCVKTKDYNSHDWVHPTNGYKYKTVESESCEKCPELIQ